MTVSEFILYPLQHRVVTEAWYETMMRIASAPQPVLAPAPLKAKRVRKAKGL